MPVELNAPVTAFTMFPLYRVPSIFRNSEKTGVTSAIISSIDRGRLHFAIYSFNIQIQY